jgi:hypothetical protein
MVAFAGNRKVKTGLTSANPDGAFEGFGRAMATPRGSKRANRKAAL